MRVLKFSLIALVAIIFTSCNDHIRSKQLDDQGDLNDAIAEINDVISVENVVAFEMRADGELSQGFGMATATYIKDGKLYDIDYDGDRLNDPREAIGIVSSLKRVYKKAPAKKMKDLNFENIGEIYNKVLEKIEADQANIDEKEQLEKFVLYTIKKRIKEDGTFETEIEITATKKGESSYQEGRNMVTNYYLMTVNANPDGTFKLSYD